MAQGIHVRSISILSLGHFFNDIYQGVVPAMLPFLVVHRGLSYAAIAGLVFAYNLSSAVVQPLFGHLSDKRPMPWLMPVGVSTAALGVAFTGLAANYATMFVLLLIAGIGIAAFHPEGARFANYVSGGRRASGMSLFVVGGNLGYAFGPILATVLLARFGMFGTLPTAITGLMAAAMLAFELPRLARFRVAYGKHAEARATREGDAWWPFVRLTIFLIVRAFAVFGLMTFVPLYEIKVHGASTAMAGAMLSIFLGGAAVGTLTSGWLADRIGRRAIIIGAMALVAALMPLFIVSTGVIGISFTGAVIGAALFGSMTAAVVLGQEYLPSRIGAASGMTLGVTISLGGLGVTVLGALADAHGLTAVMYTIGGLVVVAGVLAATLPAPRAAAALRSSPAPAR